jgi:hypothetical protein
MDETNINNNKVTMEVDETPTNNREVTLSSKMDEINNNNNYNVTMEVDETSTNNREVTSSSKMDETCNEIVVASTNGSNDELDVTINIFEDQEVVHVGLDSDIDLILEEELSVIFVGRRTKKGVTEFNQKTNKDLVKEKVKDKVLKKINEEYVTKEYMTKYITTIIRNEKEEMKKVISEKDKLINDLMEKLNINKV